MTGSVACDQCIGTFCNNEWCACAADSSVDDAGNPDGCIGYVACVQLCLFPADAGLDAGGSVAQCAAACAPSYTQQQVTDGDQLLGCIAGSCGTPSTCGQ
jgi:hypothetical protein